MPTVYPAPAAVRSFVRQSWLFAAQSAAFTNCGFAPNQQSVSSYISPWFTGLNYSPANFQTHVCVEDSQITVCLLNQALEFSQRSMCNLIGAFYLANRGLETWAKVTNYYASYFGVQALLCLQGKTITKLLVGKGTTVQVFAIDLKNHVFCFTSTDIGRNPHHQTPWQRFYEVYEPYALPAPAYQLVTRRAYVADPADESVERNLLNYTPFVGYDEIRDLAQHQACTTGYHNYATLLSSQTTLTDLLDDLKGLATDPNYKYYARAVLKVAFLAELFHSLGSTNGNLDLEWSKCKQTWIQLIASLVPDVPDCYLANVIPLLK